jgi:hypothetical protein
MIATETSVRVRLYRSHHSCRPERQLQHPTQRRQVRIPWPNAIVLPEVYALDTDANLLGNFNHR